jgi:hypothetical protein
MMGTVATIVPTVAGSAYRVDSMMNTLNAASPVIASSTTKPSSRKLSRAARIPRARAIAKSSSEPPA